MYQESDQSCFINFKKKMTLRAIFYSTGGPKSTRIAQIDYQNGYKLRIISAMHTIDYDIERLLCKE